MNPKVTIIMATYNRAHFIVETLHSIQQQTFMDWECIIIDDGGTDNTKEVINPILEQDNRFRFLKRPNTYLKGLPGCRNYGLDLVQGDYIIFFDDDDIIHPQCLEIALEGFKIRENLDFCHYQKKHLERIKLEEDLNELHILEFDKFLIKEDLEDLIVGKIGMASCLVLWKSECFFNFRFVEYLQFAEEWELYSRMISNGYEGVILHNILYLNRKHSGSNTSQFVNRDYKRRKSNIEAICLVVANLMENNLMTSNLKRHFLKSSWAYSEFQLFDILKNKFKLNLFEKLEINILYFAWKLRRYFKIIKRKVL